MSEKKEKYNYLKKNNIKLFFALNFILLFGFYLFSELTIVNILKIFVISIIIVLPLIVQDKKRHDILETLENDGVFELEKDELTDKKNN